VHCGIAMKGPEIPPPSRITILHANLSPRPIRGPVTAVIGPLVNVKRMLEKHNSHN
jgi:hypothetical protein